MRAEDHFGCSLAKRSACDNQVTLPRDRLEVNGDDVLDAAAKDADSLRERLAEHNRRIGETNEGQLRLVRRLEAEKLERALEAVQPLLLPDLAAVRDSVGGRASIVEGDLTRDRAFPARRALSTEHVRDLRSWAPDAGIALRESAGFVVATPAERRDRSERDRERPPAGFGRR